MGPPFPTPKRWSKPQNFGPPILLSLKSLGLRVLPFSTPSLLRLSLSPFSPFHGLCYIFNWIDWCWYFIISIIYCFCTSAQLHSSFIGLQFPWTFTQFSHNPHLGNQIDWTFYFILAFPLSGSCWFSICVCRNIERNLHLNTNLGMQGHGQQQHVT